MEYQVLRYQSELTGAEGRHAKLIMKQKKQRQALEQKRYRARKKAEKIKENATVEDADQVDNNEVTIQVDNNNTGSRPVTRRSVSLLVGEPTSSSTPDVSKRKITKRCCIL